MGEGKAEPSGMGRGEPRSSQKLSWGALDTQPLSEPLEPLLDMHWEEDSELSVAGDKKKKFSH